MYDRREAVFWLVVAALLGYPRTAAGWADTAPPLDVSWPLGRQLRGVAAIPRIAAAFSRYDTFTPASRPHWDAAPQQRTSLTFQQNVRSNICKDTFQDIHISHAYLGSWS